MQSLWNHLFIFEMANNHQGSLAHGLEIIEQLGRVVHRYGIRAAVKFQYRDLDTMIHPNYRNRTDVKHIPRFLSTRLTPDEFYQMVCAVKEAGMYTMCTPFDEKSVELCQDHGIEILKIASCSATDWPLLEAAAAAKKPIVISTGGKSFREMDNIYNFLIHRNVDFAMLHCVGLYPVEDQLIQLDVLDRMKNRYLGIPIGYSGHEDPSDFSAVQMAVAKGAQIFERHVGMAAGSVPLNAYSTDVSQIHLWVEAVMRAQKICGFGRDGEKWVTEEERISMNELARGCYASSPIKKGELISKEKVYFAMPCTAGQTTSGEYEQTMVASRDYLPDEAISERRVRSASSDIRSLVHDVKGMLYEAKIVIPSQFHLEISHHYGMQHVRRYGCTLIDIINREYCKKIIVVLPGQKNPEHFHKEKEETFQVLHGTMELEIQGQTLQLHPGQIYTVERGVPHAFSSPNGCIFEEVSTEHIRNDSYYTDEKISSLDPMERKTILENW